MEYDYASKRGKSRKLTAFSRNTHARVSHVYNGESSGCYGDSSAELRKQVHRTVYIHAHTEQSIHS